MSLLFAKGDQSIGTSASASVLPMNIQDRFTSGLTGWISLQSKGLSSFPGGSEVKRLPAMQEIRVQSLGWEDLLEKEMATHSRIRAWRIPRKEEHGRL